MPQLPLSLEERQAILAYLVGIQKLAGCPPPAGADAVSPSPLVTCRRLVLTRRNTCACRPWTPADGSHHALAHGLPGIACVVWRRRPVAPPPRVDALG